MRQTNPIPWKLVGQTIRDANGDVVVSAINPCDMETRKMIVAAVNAWMECNPTNNKLREVLKWAKEKAVYIARHYRTPLSLTGNVAELLAYLNAALAASRATAENSSAVGNAAAMYSCLLKILAEMTDIGGMEVGRKACFSPDAIADEIRQALAAPPRNCEVGTAEGQFERWQAFCNRYDRDCTGCPCKSPHTYAYCFACWAQMPYEEGGAK